MLRCQVKNLVRIKNNSYVYALLCGKRKYVVRLERAELLESHYM
jgi:hypothetical protein